MAVILGVPGIAIMDVVQSVAPAPEKVKMLVGLVGARLAELSEGHSVSFETPGSVIPPSTGSPVPQATLDASFDARPPANPSTHAGELSVGGEGSQRAVVSPVASLHEVDGDRGAGGVEQLPEAPRPAPSPDHGIC